MDLIMKQMPVVVSALNVGFLQTLKLFIVTLVGALPLGLVIAFGSMSHFKPLSWSYITRSGVVVKQDDSLQQPYLLSSITPVIFQKSTAVESRVFRKVRKKPVLYLV